MTDSNLSEREIELLRLVATGASNREISQRLHISVNTVKVHLRNIFTKLEVASRTEAAMWAVQKGMVEAGSTREVEGDPNRPLGVDEIGRATSWFTRIPRNVRYWLFGTVAVFLIIVGVGISQIASFVQNPEPTEDVISASEFEESRWKQLADMPTARAGLAAAAYDNQIYAIAGEGFEGVLAVNERYDPPTDSWETLRPKPIPVADVHAGVIGGRIYVPGGRTADGGVIKSLEIYDPRTEEWSQGTALPVALSAYGLATFEGKMYVFGGWDGENYLGSVYMYDPAQNTWAERTAMPTARAFAGAAEAGGKIYVIGGYDGDEALAVNEVYQPALEGGGSDISWTQGVPLTEGRYGSGVIFIADRIILLGGKNDIGSRIVSSEFSFQKFNWNGFVNPLESGNWANMGVMDLGNQVYFIGGAVDNLLVTKNIAYTAFYTVMLPFIER